MTLIKTTEESYITLLSFPQGHVWPWCKFKQMSHCRSLVRNIIFHKWARVAPIFDNISGLQGGIEMQRLTPCDRNKDFNPSASYASSLWFFCGNRRDLCYPLHHLYNQSFLHNFIWGGGEMGFRHSPDFSQTPVFQSGEELAMLPGFLLSCIRCPILVTAEWVRTVPSYSFKKASWFIQCLANFF